MNELIPTKGGENKMTNNEKLSLAIGKLLDQVNESLDKGEAINAETLTALQILIQLTSLNYHLSEQPIVEVEKFANELFTLLSSKARDSGITD